MTSSADRRVEGRELEAMMAIDKKRADSVVNISPEEFVVTVRGSHAEFAKLAQVEVAASVEIRGV